MSQNHITSDGIPGRDHIDNPSLNTMGQYHGKAPWYSNFGVQKPIRDFECTFPRAYATSLKLTRVLLVTYIFSSFLSSLHLSCSIGTSYHIITSLPSPQVRNNFIKWVAILFIKWVAIKDNILHHIANNLPLWT